MPNRSYLKAKPYRLHDASDEILVDRIELINSFLRYFRNTISDFNRRGITMTSEEMEKCIKRYRLSCIQQARALDCDATNRDELAIHRDNKRIRKNIDRIEQLKNPDQIIFNNGKPMKASEYLIKLITGRFSRSIPDGFKFEDNKQFLISLLEEGSAYDIIYEDREDLLDVSS